MIEQLLIGALLVIGTVSIQVAFIRAVIQLLNRVGSWLASPPTFRKFYVALLTLVMWLVAGLIVSAWLWAFVFLGLGAHDNLEEALYFSVVTFTTLGYGDITLGKDLRLLASICATNGLIIVGLNTAFLVESLSRIYKAQHKESK